MKVLGKLFHNPGPLTLNPLSFGDLGLCLLGTTSFDLLIPVFVPQTGQQPELGHVSVTHDLHRTNTCTSAEQFAFMFEINHSLNSLAVLIELPREEPTSSGHSHFFMVPPTILSFCGPLL